MDDMDEDAGWNSREGVELSPPHWPPLRLAGIDEDDAWESHVVRGID
ncbi:hypothetical protein [Streptomyces hyaluromycini]|nr:hypothetical protein [Streptomyces hyaluromycini]